MYLKIESFAVHAYIAFNIYALQRSISNIEKYSSLLPCGEHFSFNRGPSIINCCFPIPHCQHGFWMVCCLYMHFFGQPLISSCIINTIYWSAILSVVYDYFVLPQLTVEWLWFTSVLHLLYLRRWKDEQSSVCANLVRDESGRSSYNLY